MSDPTRPSPIAAAPETALKNAYPAIGDYGLIGDCHTAALVARSGSIDWCCLPRFDSDSCFGRLLDRRQGGFFAIEPDGVRASRRAYLGSSLVLATTFDCDGGTLRLIDFFAMRRGGRDHPRRELVRIVEALEGDVAVRVTLSPRLDFGAVKPWIYRNGDTAFVVVGSNTALRVEGDIALAIEGKHDLRAAFVLHAGRRAHVTMRFVAPERADEAQPAVPAPAAGDLLDETLAWWSEWSARLQVNGTGAGPDIVRSAITLKALTYAPTGAIIAAPTTSLPEAPGGERNWDYRYSWIRDSVFTVRTLAELGCDAEADGFRRFVQRSAAGNAGELQVMFAIDGKRRLTEVNLPDLEGWRGARPVRIGNAAAEQFQSDMYGLLLGANWRWSQRGNVPSRDDWEFLCSVVEAARLRWPAPDHGLWEMRDQPRHFVHSKVMCWAAVNYGLQLAEAFGLEAPLDAWREARAAIRAAVLQQGVDRARGVFVAAFGGRALDAALLLLPITGFIDFRDPLMMRTTRAIRDALTHDGLVRRYDVDDGLAGDEGVFLPCSFWLVECLARQGEVDAARVLFDRACACANDLGLFAEEYDPDADEMLGNFPQGLTHLAHIAAALALARAVKGAAPPAP